MTSSPTLDPNSADYWLPRIEGIGALIPTTVIIPYNHDAVLGAFEGGEDWDGWDALVDAVWNATIRTGVPSFLRTDLASAKHDGPSSYLVEDRESAGRAISLTAQDNEMKFWPGGPTPRSLLVRQFLDLNAPFNAFGGHPIAREWRYFAKPAGLSCAHFYWPKDAIVRPDRTDWESALEAMSKPRPPADLIALATRAANACPAAEEWSVDFAQSRDGRWWLIDMAVAEESWHPEHED